MRRSANLERTVKTNIILYKTDGMGRDGYITYNNGGFWKKNIKQINLKKDYPRNKYNIFHSLIHQAAPFNYYNDGSGRDTYVANFNSGLVKPFESLANQRLTKFLRRNNSSSDCTGYKAFLSKSEIENLKKIHKIQNNVTNRLYNKYIEKFMKTKLVKNSSSDYLFKKPILIEETQTTNYPKNFSSNLSPINKNKNKKDIDKDIDKNEDKKKELEKGKNFENVLKFKFNKFHFPKNKRNFRKLYKINSTGELKSANISKNNLENNLNKNNKTHYNNNNNEEILFYNTFSDKNFLDNNYMNIRKQDTIPKDKDKEENNAKIYDIKKFSAKNYFSRTYGRGRFFSRTQIFDRTKPFLVDDFRDYGKYEKIDK